MVGGIEEVKRSSSVNSISQFKQDLGKNAEVAQLVQTLLKHQVDTGSKNTNLTNALREVNNQISKGVEPSVKSLNALNDALGTNNKAKQIVANALNDISGSNNNNKTNNLVDLSVKDKQASEGPTEISADGREVKQEVHTVKGGGNTDGDDKGSGFGGNDGMANELRKISATVSNKHESDPVLFKMPSFESKQAYNRAKQLGAMKDPETGKNTSGENIAEALKSLEKKGELNEVMKNLNNATRP